jgi:radical SAM superfamily enzyme YgiQ (UPF0313 family)
MKILLVIPPMTQLNTPYPSTAYLTGFLRSRGYQVEQRDASLLLALKIFSSSGLEAVAAEIKKNIPAKKRGLLLQHFLANEEKYKSFIDPVLSLLQGNDLSLVSRFADAGFFPQGPQFKSLEELASANEGDELQWAFGSMGDTDRAKYLSSLMLADLASVVREGVDERFGLVRWAEDLAASNPTIDSLLKTLESKRLTLIDQWTDELAKELLKNEKYDLIGFTAPFPGNVYGAFRMARAMKKLSPHSKFALGGGWVNTELRHFSDPRLFDYFDFVSLDDGEQPMISILEHLESKRKQSDLFRVFVREKNEVKLITNTKDHDVPHSKTGFPTYDGLPLKKYLGIFEMLNPMHRLWSQNRWNKLTLAHGCYWKKCTFCDLSLDYIGRYEPGPVDLIVERMDRLAAETGSKGFHFVDEAAPPKLLGQLSDALIEKGRIYSWWSNIRFEKSFTRELTEKMAKAGCLAVTGGLEVASDRLLKLMQKGVTVEQVAQVTRNFVESGVMVHAYLMYGFPTQTIQETIDSLERVRQLFKHNCLQSAYWHRFSATAHSPIGMAPEKYGIKIADTKDIAFAQNDLDFEDSTGVDHSTLEDGLKKALYNYMHGVGLDEDVRIWFDHVKVPKTKVDPQLVERALLS